MGRAHAIPAPGRTPIGGTFLDRWATGQYHTDAVHVNAKGYCHVFNMPAVQAFLGCTSDVLGLPRHTADDAEATS